MTQDELKKIYTIVEIALETEMTDVITMAYNLNWFKVLDSNINVISFQKLLKLSFQCKNNYYTILKHNFPKLYEQCSYEYKEFYLKVQIAKRSNKCYYYNILHSCDIQKLLPYLYNGCIIQCQQLFIVDNNKFEVLPLNDDNKYFIPLYISKKYENPAHFFNKLLNKNIILNIQLCPYVHRIYIGKFMIIDRSQLYLLYKNKIVNLTQTYSFI